MPKDGEVKSTSKGVGKLTDKQKRFIEEYLVDLNATQAAIRAGYSEKTANEQGAQNLAKLSVYIEQALETRSTRTLVTQDDVIKGLLEEAQWQGEGSSHSARVSAWAHLGKHLGMFKDKVELSGNVTTANIQLSKEEFADIAKNLLSDV